MIIKGFKKGGRRLYFDSAAMLAVKSYWDGGNFYVNIWLSSGSNITLEPGSGIKHNGVDITNDGTFEKADEVADILGEIMILERG